MPLSRRELLRAGLAAGAALPWWSACAGWPAERGPSPFLHGVASGDPLADRVILWTRVTPLPGGPSEVEVEWRVARDPGLREAVARGRAAATAERDHTVKVDAAGLDPGATWYYGFRALGHDSPVGRTRTLPTGSPGRLRLAFCSCSNLPWGFFNAYAHLAVRDDLDAVLHLGDYLYEQGGADYGAGIGRAARPDHEITTLADYRERHAQYKADPDAQAVHARHPFIAVWDDHEFANDAWKGGAQNHQPGEGDWMARRTAAARAYFEWMPIREASDPADPRIYRHFRFGDLADLVMLDTRIVGRDRLVAPNAPERLDPRRTILDAAQERWLAERLVASRRDGVAWRVLGQQVMLAPMHRPDGSIVSPDKWDGYPASRERLLDVWEQEDVRDNVVLTGDFHSSWAMDLPRDPYGAGYDARTGRGSRGVELLVPGVSSPSGVRPDRAQAYAERLRRANPHLHWVDFRHCGYGLLDLDREGARGTWLFVDTVRERRLGERVGAAWRTARGADHLEPASPVSASAAVSSRARGSARRPSPRWA